jgi:serine/threonine protein kinase
MSPEQMQTAMADVRNDIYSIGVILQQMDLGLRYRSIINRCVQPIDHRYQNAQELLNSMHSTERRIKKSFAWTGVLMVAALLILIGWQLWRSKGQGDRLAEQNIFYQQEQKMQQQKMEQLTDSMAELKAYNRRIKEKEETAEAKRKHVKDAINKGIVIIDKTMCETKIDQHLDTLSNVIYLWPDFAERWQSGFRATETYLQQIKSSFDDNERAQIADAMNQHCAAIIEKWKNKIVELSK